MLLGNAPRRSSAGHVSTRTAIPSQLATEPAYSPRVSPRGGAAPTFGFEQSGIGPGPPVPPTKPPPAPLVPGPPLVEPPAKVPPDGSPGPPPPSGSPITPRQPARQTIAKSAGRTACIGRLLTPLRAERDLEAAHFFRPGSNVAAKRVALFQLSRVTEPPTEPPPRRDPMPRARASRS